MNDMNEGQQSARILEHSQAALGKVSERARLVLWQSALREMGYTVELFQRGFCDYGASSLYKSRTRDCRTGRWGADALRIGDCLIDAQGRLGWEGQLLDLLAGERVPKGHSAQFADRETLIPHGTALSATELQKSQDLAQLILQDEAFCAWLSSSAAESATLQRKVSRVVRALSSSTLDGATLQQRIAGCLLRLAGEGACQKAEQVQLGRLVKGGAQLRVQSTVTLDTGVILHFGLGEHDGGEDEISTQVPGALEGTSGAWQVLH